MFFKRLFNAIMCRSFVTSKMRHLAEKIDRIDRDVDFANMYLLRMYKKVLFIEQSQRVMLPPVETLEPSCGWLREIHRGGGKLLELVDIICRDNNIPYWLYAGSLIGAKMYGHALPWDDDWDIGMLRPDWERFRDICERLFENSDYKPLFIGFSIQMQYKDTVVRGDVFPFDQYYKRVDTDQELKELKDDLITVKQNCDWQWWHWEEAFANPRSVKIRDVDDYNKTKEVYKRFVLKGNEIAPDGVLMENPVNPGHWIDGYLCHYTKTNNIFNSDWIFPLKTIMYEGIKVSCPNDPDKLLARKFGDIYEWPISMDNHNLKAKVTMEMMQDVKKLLSLDMRAEYRKLKHMAGL